MIETVSRLTEFIIVQSASMENEQVMLKTLQLVLTIMTSSSYELNQNLLSKVI